MKVSIGTKLVAEEYINRSNSIMSNRKLAKNKQT